jgi:hypothetical protein
LASEWLVFDAPAAGEAGSLCVGSGSGWIVAGAGRIGARLAGAPVTAGDAGDAAADGRAGAAEDRSTRMGAGELDDAAAGEAAADGDGAGVFALAGGWAESGLNAIATSAASAKADVSACLSSLASELSRASTSPGDCSFVPSPHAEPISVAIASVVKRERLIIRQPIRWESIGSSAIPAPRVAS